MKDGKLPSTNYYKMNWVLTKMADDFKFFKINENEDIPLRFVPNEKPCLPICLIGSVFNGADKGLNEGHPGTQKTVN